MANKYYCISQSWYEDGDYYYFYGPEVEDWNELCQSILEEAVNRAIEEEKKDDYPNYIYCRTIYKSMTQILLEKGYIFVNAEAEAEWCNWGGDLILPEHHYGDTTELETKIPKKSIEAIQKHHDYCKKRWEEIEKEEKNVEEGL